jgi:hypothetical protein
MAENYIPTAYTPVYRFAGYTPLFLAIPLLYDMIWV